MGNEKSENKKKEEKNPNGWAFCIFTVGKLFDLVSTKNAGAVILFVTSLCILSVAFKYPSKELPDLLKGVGKFLRSERFYIFPLGMISIISIWGNFMQRKIYKKEIDRISAERKSVIHGIDSGELKILKKHNSSIIEEVN